MRCTLPVRAVPLQVWRTLHSRIEEQNYQVRKMQLESTTPLPPRVTSSVYLPTMPPLPKKFQLPNHASLTAGWKGDARKAIVDALSPLLVQRESTKAVQFLETNDALLSAFIHPTALPRGPLRNAFAMPALPASQGTVFWKFCLEVANKCNESGEIVTVEQLLVPWMKAKCLDRHVLYSSELLGATIPDDVLVPAGLTLTGVVLCELGRVEASHIVDDALSLHLQSPPSPAGTVDGK